MNYCPSCGEKVHLRTPAGDNRPRFVCESCEEIHYQNPRIIAGCIPVWEDKILLCKRAIDPQYGKWTIPCGFMENGETAEEGGMRETMEEANAEVEIESLHTVYSIPHINQVYLIFLSHLKNLNFSPGPESLETVLRTGDEIPWDEIAFSSIEYALRNYVNFPERRRGPTHLGQYQNTPRP